MKYNLYIHNDFDGLASATVLYDFLNQRDDTVASCTPMHYHPDLKLQWPDYVFDEPFIVLDFLYHPKAAWWFDHHPTTFISADWQQNFVPDSQHVFDEMAYSCCSLVMKSLQKHFKYQPPAHIIELAKWLDIIDAARYVSVQQAIERKEPALQFLSLIDSIYADGKGLEMIQQLATGPIESIIQAPRAQKIIAEEYQQRQQATDLLQQKCELHNRVIYADITETTVHVPRFLEYWLYPEAIYSVVLKRKGDVFHGTVGKNPWQTVSKEIHLGDLVRQYGGGGHKNVAGFEAKSHETLVRIGKDIVEYLNYHE